MIDFASFFLIYMVLFFIVVLFGVSKFGHWGISKLILGAVQLVLLYKLYQFDEIRVAESLVLTETDLSFGMILILFQITSFFLLPDTRESFFKAVLSCILVIGLLVSMGSTTLLTFFLAIQLANYSFMGSVAMDKGGKVSLNSLRIFMKNEFYNGFFLLFLFFYLMSTGSLSLVEVEIGSTPLFSLSALMFVAFFLARIGIFPFHSNDTDIIRTTRLVSMSFGLILLKSGLLYSSYKVLSVLINNLEPDHLSYLYLIFRILGITTIIYAGLISTWSKNFYDSVSYLYVVLMGFLAFIFSLESIVQIQQLSFVYVAISALGLVLFLAHSTKFMDKSSELIRFPTKALPIAWALITLGIMIGIPASPGFDIKIYIMKVLATKGHILDLIASCLIVLFGIQILKFFRMDSSPFPNNYAVLKNTIGLQLYSAIVLLGVILFSINPALLLESFK
jgi:formate hydrogenlyase subunit 3/multisubunit Na+/H+ antiporter MnhD subunit